MASDRTQVRQFVVHKSASKHRIFAVQNWTDQLEAVTTLDPTVDELMADRLATVLNEALATSDLSSFKPMLDQLPEPVKLSVTAFFQSHTSTEPGDITSFGAPVYFIRLAYISDEEELEYQMSAAYDLGIGARIHNTTNDADTTVWVLELRTDPGFAPLGQAARSWPLPADARLLHTWTSEHAGNDPTAAAMAVARQANGEGHLTRLHIVERATDGGPHPRESLEWVVDVFDTPVPTEEDED